MRKRILVAILILGVHVAAQAHVAGHPSIHDAMAAIVGRLCDNLPADDLRRLDPEQVWAHVTDEERHVLATEYWSFDVTVPVTVWVAVHASQDPPPFWLEERDFEKTPLTVEVERRDFDVWKKDFDAERIGLGINGFGGHPFHYFVALTPQQTGAEIDVDRMYPGRHRDIALEVGESVYVDERDAKVDSLPEALEGALLVRAVMERTEETQLKGAFRMTDYPAAATPDQVVLTWSDDPQTTQTVQWRTNTEVADGAVQFHPEGAGAADAKTVDATMHTLEDPYLANDRVNHRYTAVMAGLSPGTDYLYRVGSPEKDLWSDWVEFTTAPAETQPFSFVYMGDAQNGLDTWGNLVHKAYDEHPQAAFYVMAGDLVNRGNDRDDWDSLFANAAGIYDRRPVVPAIGNHECQGDEGPWMYLSVFDLPKDNPEDTPPERAYCIEYSNAIIIALDSNLPVHMQTDWLEEKLANTDATWKFVTYHHPAYSSAPRRDNALLRKRWGAIFDKYHVDLALQGHDHAYLRTYPMNNEKPVDSPADGTIYLVTVAGTKYYDQVERDTTAFGMANTSTFQVLDITIDGNTLTYRAYDIDGKIRDEFVIQK